jgi:hypothetical protein
MDMAAATRSDWRLWPNREAVTLRVVAPLDTYTAHALPDAKRRAPTWKERTASAGVYTATDLVWLIPDEVLDTAGAPVPKAGDQVRDAGSTDWTVLEVAVGKFGQTHRCVTRSLALHDPLRDSATVRRPAPAPDASGLRRPNLAVLAAAVPCRLQPDGWQEEPETAGRVTTRSRYRCYLGQALLLRAGDVVEVSGVKYEARSQSEIAQLDSLTSVAVDRIG